MRLVLALSCLCLPLIAACGDAALPKSARGVLIASQNAADNSDPQPMAEETPEPARLPVSQREADYVSFEGGLRAYPQQRRVEMDAVLLSEQTRPLEFLLVAPGGAIHESLFATGVRGEHLKRALEIIGLKEAETKRSGRGYFDKPLGDRVMISVRFQHAETGESKTVRVEQWLWDHRLDSHPEPVGFVFTGSHEQFQPQLNRSTFDADLKGNLIALWRDASCVLDNDRESGPVPDVYSPYPNAPGIPKSRAGFPPPVTLIFEPHA
jgi:hypothetical protein